MTSFVKNILILDEIETLTGYIVFENAELKFTSSYVFAFKYNKNLAKYIHKSFRR